jgi:hypothetical protein
MRNAEWKRGIPADDGSFSKMRGQRLFLENERKRKKNTGGLLSQPASKQLNYSRTLSWPRRVMVGVR